MKSCFFLTPRDAGSGFGLAGFRQVVVAPGTVVAAVEKIVRAETGALVIIDERLLSESETARLRLLEKTWSGAVVVLPAPDGEETGGAQDYGNRLIARVLGYQMKLS